eukprot:10131044-Lingulodinium_polyedra.AAC.1
MRAQGIPEHLDMSGVAGIAEARFHCIPAQSVSHAFPKQFSNSPHGVPEQFPSSFQTVPKQFPSSSHAVPK